MLLQIQGLENLQLLFILLLSFSLFKCYAQETFLQCMSSQFFKSNITGVVYSPKSQGYSSIIEHAQKNPRWLNSSSAHPLFIISPRKEFELRPVILCSKIFGLQIRVLGGGHDYEGVSFRAESPFVMIDMSNLDEITIDLEEETAWIQAGETLGQLYYEIAKKSSVHAFPGGICFTTGSGGLISGGGLGSLIRKFGLAADNVVDARVMDANGRILDRKSMGEDFFWAIRGGGGSSFGIILAWKLKLFQVPEKVSVFRVHRMLVGNTINLIHQWEHKAYLLPKEFFLRMYMQNDGAGKEKKVKVTFEALFLGTVNELIPIVSQHFPDFNLEHKDFFKEPVINCSDRPCLKKECHEVPWIGSVLFLYNKGVDESIEVLLDSSIPVYKNYFKGTSDFVKTPFPESGWKMIERLFLEEDRPMIILEPFGGRMDEISESELPFPHRKGNLYNIQHLVNWDDNSESVLRNKIEWMRKFYREMEPFVANSPRTAYLNYRDLDFGTNQEDYSYSKAKIWGEKYFKGNFERLAKVKSKVDPDNFFRYQQSIPPFAITGLTNLVEEKWASVYIPPELQLF
ncbi:reticuline oxidase-like protein [Nicotiana attenuata]|uniref:Reticuline oxidase-like protein n=1 Tax=Nicotiana attenuata TaxID=49451 RepID=A0A1J6IQD0_NICAT|nr:reticuline oxidase-like protein [Nicotiana attenuata]